MLSLLKTWLLIALASAPGLYSSPDFRASSDHHVKQKISITTPILQLKSSTSPGKEKADAERIATETKDSAAATKLYDTIMPPLCFLMLAWLSLRLPGSGKRSP